MPIEPIIQHVLESHDDRLEVSGWLCRPGCDYPKFTLDLAGGTRSRP